MEPTKSENPAFVGGPSAANDDGLPRLGTIELPLDLVVDAVADRLALRLEHLLLERSQPDPDEVLAIPVADAARRLSVSDSTVRRMVQAGLLPSCETGTGRTLIPVWALEELVGRK